MECESTETPWVWMATSRLRPWNDPFFDEGNEACYLCHKQFKTISDSDDDLEESSAPFACQVGQCSKTFHTITSYEAHYHSTHSNRCAACSKVLPTARLLEIHVLENHDSMFPLLAAKQKMFQCIVATCLEVFSKPEERKEHLIKVHCYPASFRFDRTKKNKKSKSKENAMDVETASLEGPEPMEVTRRFSYKVPKEISFGHGRPKTFHQKKPNRKHWHQKEQTTKTKVNIEEVHMKDLAEALGS